MGVIAIVKQSMDLVVLKILQVFALYSFNLLKFSITMFEEFKIKIDVDSLFHFIQIILV